MDNTGEMLEKLKNLSDAELESAIHSVAKALGANERMASKLAADREKIRKRLTGASEGELKRAMSHLNADQLDSIITSLGKGGDNGSK